MGLLRPTAHPDPHCPLPRREQLQLEARRALEAADSWWKAGPPAPNVAVATSPQHFKSLVVDAPPHSIVVAYFFSPQCHACKSLYPKLRQIAASNSDVTFVKVNAAAPPMADLVQGLQVAKLPWFTVFAAGSGEQLASFTANVSTVSTLRAEIAAAKECTAPECTAQR